MDELQGGASFVIMSGQDESSREIGELVITEETLSDEDLMMLSATLSNIAKMILIELGLVEEDERDPDFHVLDKTQFH